MWLRVALLVTLFARVAVSLLLICLGFGGLVFGGLRLARVWLVRGSFCIGVC